VCRILLECVRNFYIAFFFFVALYGRNAPVISKIGVALRNLRSLSGDEFRGHVIEFEHFLDSLGQFSKQEPVNPTSKPSPPPAARNVFIIHGHGEMNSLRLQALLRDHFKLNPVVMKKEAGMADGFVRTFQQGNPESEGPAPGSLHCSNYRER
jgi:hypothetical protein